MDQFWEKIIGPIGEDLQRPEVLNTPKGASEAHKFLKHGYHLYLWIITYDALFPSNSSEMILFQDIELYSACEFYFLPFVGRYYVTYLPQSKALGLSKEAQIVGIFARRLQIQDQLTLQIAKSIREVKGAQGVGVII